MGRGLGPRQLSILDKLAALDPGDGMFVSDLCDDPDNKAERSLVVSAVNGLKRRGLVSTERRGNPSRETLDARYVVRPVAPDSDIVEVGIVVNERAVNETCVFILWAGRQHRTP